MKFTQGPWEVDGFVRGKNTSHPNSYHVVDQSGRLIAAVKTKHDAKIISKLPELFKALQTCQSVLFEYVHGD